ncbi:DDE-type integrase/transposase/recombinase [Halomonas marinisediminis]|uniref:Transposase n=1 Tax=Halomonas marinisediminis TaxID=2546095 RepID=A0ABY2DAG5_9GAMM|nr:transposase [Halomonas marinisediminis]
MTRPNACWSWDVTYLPTQVRGQFYYLYMIVDIYSRKIVDAEVFDQESMANSSEVIQRAVLREGCINQPLVLHADSNTTDTRSNWIRPVLKNQANLCKSGVVETLRLPDSHADRLTPMSFH